MFDTLKQNKIKFFVLYIGDISQNFYQQNLLCNNYEIEFSKQIHSITEEKFIFLLSEKEIESAIKIIFDLFNIIVILIIKNLKIKLN